ncbi:unnamed protein product [Closterium sp. NIES-65]|nr:unnamed protein product [Closterium sp. NIES-65]
MHRRILVACLPRVLPPLPPSPAHPCLPCVEGRQRAAPHSSFPPTTAPLQTLHLDVWGPARLRERFGTDFPVLRLHSDRGGEFASDFLMDFCRGKGIHHAFTLPSSPQQNGIAERRIGLVMEVARTSMVHAATPQFLWPFAVRYVGDASVFRVWGSRAFVRDTTADKLSTQAIPCVFLGFVRDVDAVELVEVAVDSGGAAGGADPECVEPGGDEPEHVEPGGAELECVEPWGAEPERVESGGAEPGVAKSEGVEPGGAESEGAKLAIAETGGAESARVPAGASSRQEARSLQQLREWFACYWRRQRGAAGAAGGTAGGVGATGAASGAGAAGARGAARAGAAGGTAGAGAAGGAGDAGPRGARTGATGAAGAGGAAGVAAGGASGAGAAGGAGAGGAVGVGARDPGGGGTCAVSAASGGAVRPRPYFVLLLQQVLDLLPSTGTHEMTLRPSTAPLRVPLPSIPASSLADGPDPESDSLRAASPTVTRLLATVVTDPSFESTAASPLVAELVDFATALRLDYAASLLAESESVCPPSVGGECALDTDVVEDRQEDFECFAAALPHLVSMLIAPEGDPYAPDIPTPRSYAKAIEGPYSSQVKRSRGSPPVFKARFAARGFSQREGFDFFQAFSPTPKMTTIWVLLRIAARRDYELHSLDFSTAFLQGSLNEEIRLRRPLGFIGSFPAGTQWSLRRPIYSLRQALRKWHDTLRTTLAALGFDPSTADLSLFLRTDASLPPFYVLVYVDDSVFATVDTEGLVHVKSELQKRHTCTSLGELRSYLGLQITRDRAECTITLTQSHMVQQVLQRFGFTYSLPQPTPLPTCHSLSALPSNESVELSGPYPELVGCLIYLMTCNRPDLTYPLSILARYVAPGRHTKEHMDAAKRVLHYLRSTSGMGLVLGGRARVVLTSHADASWADDLATQRSSQGYTFSLGSSSISWRSTRSSSVLSSSCEAEIYAGAMATQELRWLTYLLTNLGEPPRSPPVLYVDNKAMIALCEEQRLEHRTKHIALRHFLARELKQCGQLPLAYVATWANTADVFTKALQPCDHQLFCTVLGLVPTGPHLLTS